MGAPVAERRGCAPALRKERGVVKFDFSFMAKASEPDRRTGFFTHWTAAGVLVAVALLTGAGVRPATAAATECQIGDAKLEEAVLHNPKLRGPANRRSVQDLRKLRDAAFTLWSYGRYDDCERLLDNI